MGCSKSQFFIKTDGVRTLFVVRELYEITASCFCLIYTPVHHLSSNSISPEILVYAYILLLKIIWTVVFVVPMQSHLASSFER